MLACRSAETNETGHSAITRRPLKVYRILMNLRRFAIVMLWACAVSWSHSAKSADLYDNLSRPVTINGPFSDVSWPALSFKTTAVDFVLDSVTIPIRNPNVLASGTLTFRLFDANGTLNTPGAQVGASLGSVPIASISSASYQDVTFSGLNRTLSANTNYYVAVQSIGLSNSYFIGATTSTGGTIAGSLGYSATNNSGGTWSAPSNSFYIVGRVTAVPEPSAYILSGLGVLAMALAARRRTKKATT